MTQPLQSGRPPESGWETAEGSRSALGRQRLTLIAGGVAGVAVVAAALLAYLYCAAAARRRRNKRVPCARACEDYSNLDSVKEKELGLSSDRATSENRDYPILGNLTENKLILNNISRGNSRYNMEDFDKNKISHGGNGELSNGGSASQISCQPHPLSRNPSICNENGRGNGNISLEHNESSSFSDKCAGNDLSKPYETKTNIDPSPRSYVCPNEHTQQYSYNRDLENHQLMGVPSDHSAQGAEHFATQFKDGLSREGSLAVEGHHRRPVSRQSSTGGDSGAWDAVLCDDRDSPPPPPAPPSPHQFSSWRR